MKFLYFTDFHLTDRKPLRRIDNFIEAQLSKLDQIFALAKSENVDYIFEGGDLIDKDFSSLPFLAQISNIFKKYDIKNYYKVLGNHDLIGYNLKSYKDGVTGFFELSSYLNILDNIEDDKVIVKGLHFTKDIPTSYYFKSDKMKILIIHHYITVKPMIFNHLLVKDFKTDADIVLLGHLHEPFTIKIKNTTFINTGCIFRKSITEKENKVSVLIVDTKTREIELKEIKINNDVFEKVERTSEREEENFLNDLQEINDFRLENVWDLLQKLPLTELIRQECSNRLSQSEEELRKL